LLPWHPTQNFVKLSFADVCSKFVGIPFSVDRNSGGRMKIHQNKKRGKVTMTNSFIGWVLRS